MIWRVEFQMADPHWAARYEHEDFRTLWDSIPWTKTIHRDTEDERSARDQYNKLKEWADNKSQPIREVRLLQATGPLWEPAKP